MPEGVSRYKAAVDEGGYFHFFDQPPRAPCGTTVSNRCGHIASRTGGSYISMGSEASRVETDMSLYLPKELMWAIHSHPDLAALAS